MGVKMHRQLVRTVADDPVTRPDGTVVTGSHIEGELVCPDCGRDLISVGDALACGRLTIDQVYSARARLKVTPAVGDVFSCGSAGELELDDADAGDPDAADG